MKRAIATCAAIAATVCGTSRAGAVERVWIAPGFALQSIAEPMLGQARVISDGLGLSRVDGDHRWILPRATIGLDLDPRFGVDLTASWFHDSMTATSGTPIAYHARRDVFPVSALIRYATSDSESPMILGAGAVVGLTRFTEAGWLGDGTRFHPTAGLTGRIGGRLGSPDFRFSYGLYFQWLYLPRENPLLADGGSAAIGGVDASLDFGL